MTHTPDLGHEPAPSEPFADPVAFDWEEPAESASLTSPHREINERRALLENPEGLRLARSL
jgi:hypothetical protein